MPNSPDISSEDSVPAYQSENIDELIQKLSRVCAKLRDSLPVEIETKLMLARLKREKIRALTVALRSQSILAEMEINLATRELNVELKNLIEASKMRFGEDGRSSQQTKNRKRLHADNAANVDSHSHGKRYKPSRCCPHCKTRDTDSEEVRSGSFNTSRASSRSSGSKKLYIQGNSATNSTTCTTNDGAHSHEANSSRRRKPTVSLSDISEDGEEIPSQANCHLDNSQTKYITQTPQSPEKIDHHMKTIQENRTNPDKDCPIKDGNDEKPKSISLNELGKSSDDKTADANCLNDDGNKNNDNNCLPEGKDCAQYPENDVNAPVCIVNFEEAVDNFFTTAKQQVEQDREPEGIDKDSQAPNEISAKVNLDNDLNDCADDKISSNTTGKREAEKFEAETNSTVQIDSQEPHNEDGNHDNACIETITGRMVDSYCATYKLVQKKYLASKAIKEDIPKSSRKTTDKKHNVSTNLSKRKSRYDVAPSSVVNHGVRTAHNLPLPNFETAFGRKSSAKNITLHSASQSVKTDNGFGNIQTQIEKHLDRPGPSHRNTNSSDKIDVCIQSKPTLGIEKKIKKCRRRDKSVHKIENSDSSTNTDKSHHKSKQTMKISIPTNLLDTKADLRHVLENRNNEKSRSYIDTKPKTSLSLKKDKNPPRCRVERDKQSAKVLEIEDRRRLEQITSVYEEVMNYKQFKVEPDNQSLSSAVTLCWQKPHRNW